MYLIYNTLLIISGILLLPVTLMLFIIKPKLRAGFLQKIGFYPPKTSDKTIWIHAVSVGEVNAVENLVKNLKIQHPDKQFVLTTVTKTGQEVARNKLSDIVDNILYFPYDFSFSIKSAIKSINPETVIIAETEIWPNFSKEIKKHNIHLIIVNGRISPGSYKNYKKFRFFFRKLLSNYSLILMQTEEDKNRIINIGANPEIVETMGNLKYDNNEALEQTEIQKLKESLNKNNNKIFIGGSTHRGEDEIILNVYKKLKMEIPELKLILAPRHPERHSQVINLISATGFKFGLRSKNDNFSNKEIILLDTMGELGKIYSICDIAFVGGSFSGTGGHNPLEPAIYGIPVLSGPDIFNFKDIYSYMTLTNAAIIVKNELELYEKNKMLLCNTEIYNKTSNNCKNIFESNRGAIQYALSKFKDIIK